MLTEVCGMAQKPAKEVSAALQSCLAHKPAKLRAHVAVPLSLKDLLDCFELPDKVGAAELLPGPAVGETAVGIRSAGRDVQPVPLLLKTTSANEFDLGMLRSHPLLLSPVTLSTLTLSTPPVTSPLSPSPLSPVTSPPLPLSTLTSHLSPSHQSPSPLSPSPHSPVTSSLSPSPYSPFPTPTILSLVVWCAGDE